MIEFVLPAIPLLALLVSLLLGRFPGLDAALRLGDRLASLIRRRVATAVGSVAPRQPRRRAARGGLLLALSLSGRAPPGR